MGDSSLYVVGIGASAGGLEALQHFFDNLAQDTAMAFVVVQHLSPDFKSLMDELLGRHTRLPIRLVEDGMQVEGGHVYLIPPKKEMIISGGRLLLSERDRQQELSLPIDVFFRSLAQDCGPRAIAIVLSGSGSDGSRGICDVHEAGGLVVIQDIDSAQFDGMPRTARETGAADWVLAPQHMPRVLEQHVARGGKARPAAPEPASAATSASAEAFADVYRMLERDFGIDFTHYKPSTITRRIERRLRLARTEDIEQYVARLRSDRGELDVLYRDLLIGVTRFFRNDEAFALLAEQVIPELLRNHAPDDPVRVWVAGCATGEEAYSIAMLLHEATADHADSSFKIFATDVHRGSLEVASRAFYSEASLRNLSPARRERFFARVGAGYQLVPELRQSIVFAQHNVIKDAPFTRVDLISCRNMLIYLQPSVQQKVLSQFHFALNRGGILVLGPSESPGTLVRDFAPVDRTWRIYKKHSDVRIPIDPRLQPRQVPARPPIATPLGTSTAQLLATYDALLDEVMPPSLLVDDRWGLVHAFGGASRFLRPRDGRPASDVAAQVGDELARVLAGGLRRALLAEQPIVFKQVRALPGDEPALFDVALRRVTPKGQGAAHVLITFTALDGAVARPAPSATELALDDMSRERLGELQSELTYTKENLQAAIEQLEMGNEELQASNEELMSSNEELQSTNEELQSVNEELYTVNAEYQSKITELTELTNDMDNLLASTDIGTIFLDGQLRIRKFTPQIAESFNLLPNDVGRPIESFAHTLDLPDLGADLRRVLATGERVEREVHDHAKRSLFLRILPYRAKGGTAGAVVTFVDVTGLKTAEDALFHARYLLDSLMASTPDAIFFRDTAGRFIRVNPAAAARLGLEDPARAVGKLPAELPAADAGIEIHRADDDVLRTGAAQHYKLESRRRADDTTDWNLATRLPLVDREQRVIGMIGISRDVSAQKRAEANIQEAIRRRDDFLAMLSHELRNPLAAVVSATEMLKTGEPADRWRLVDILDRQSQQMARLLDDLLDASRVTHDKIELRKQRVDLREIVDEAIAAARPAIAARRQLLAVSIDAGELPVDGDPARLQQVVVNLLTNATKYTPESGHIEVQVGAEVDHAIVRVRDDGVGIAPDMVDAVFELFVQSNRTLDRAQGGIGVGLTLARALAEMHGGSVHAASDGAGKGSTFVARLPLASGSRPRMTAVRATAPGGDGRRVLVVEDNEDARELLVHMLVRAGWECRAAADGLAALALAAAFHPHAAIIDVGLPGIDGFELARRIRRDPAHAGATLVAVTGYGQPTDRSTALEAGFDTHIVKPVKLDELLRLIEPRAA